MNYQADCGLLKDISSSKPQKIEEIRQIIGTKKEYYNTDTKLAQNKIE